METLFHTSQDEIFESDRGKNEKDAVTRKKKYRQLLCNFLCTNGVGTNRCLSIGELRVPQLTLELEKVVDETCREEKNGVEEPFVASDVNRRDRRAANCKESSSIAI